MKKKIYIFYEEKYSYNIDLRPLFLFCKYKKYFVNVKNVFTVNFRK